MNPALIVTAAGGIAFLGGWRREGRWPAKGAEALFATGILAALFAFTAGTRVEPIARGVAWLTVLAALYTAVPAFTAKPAAPVSSTRSR